MTPRLIVLRHAKSDWDSEAASDHARPLNKRGRHDAPRVGRRLADLGWAPELVVCSDAMRTRETWRRMADLFDDAELQLEPRLYLAGHDVVRKVLRERVADTQTVMVVGHNPGWEQLASLLTGQSIAMTTANAALLESDATSWAEALGRTDWRCVHHIRPREL